jgi:SAM-dependent methyltransferase
MNASLMVPTEEEVQRVYRHRFTEADKIAKDRIWKVLVEKYFQRFIRESDTVLDLGCGYGEFLNHVRSAKRIGVDLNPDSPKHLAQDVVFQQGSVCELSPIEDNTVDVVFSSNLMEHLPGKREVEQMLREARRVLKPGGQLMLMGPNLRFLPGEYWDFWDHIVPITDRSLEEVLVNLDYRILDVRAKFLPYTTRSALPQSPALVKLYLKVPLIWGVLGRQFLARAQKP